MSIKFFWVLPTAGDSSYGNAAVHRRGERSGSTQTHSTGGVTDPRGNRYNYFDYLHQVARATDLAGFEGVFIGNSPDGDEPWIVAGYLARGTRHLTLLTEFDAARGSAVYAAKNAVSFQRYTSGRFAWHINTGGDDVQRRRQGDFVPAADLATRIEEFVTVAKGVTGNSSFSFKGRFFEVLEGGFKGPLGNSPQPAVYLSGERNADIELSARIADVHIFSAQSVAELQEQIERLNTLAAAAGRTVAAGLRINLLARESTSEAIADAQRYLEQTTGKPLATASTVALWPKLHADAAATLVGSHEEISQALAGYAAAGISHFILGAAPALEEAYRVGENILPALRQLTGSPSRRVA